MRKLLILPYFGTFNNYFKLWLHSCGYNKGFDWLIITDAEINRDCLIPPNVKVVQQSFDMLRTQFQKKLDIDLCLKEPYKLCDFKPFYGYLFSEYLKGYDFWGYCDCDVIFGDLSRFLPDSLFEKNDKLLRTGHLSFIRNTKEINELFRQYETYRITLTSPLIYGYDESIEGYHLGFAGELLENGFHFYQKEVQVADIDFRTYPFRVVSNPEQACVFSYENGSIYRIDYRENVPVKTEMMYLHLQKRKMSVCEDINDVVYLIRPNEFIPYQKDLLEDVTFWESVRTEQSDYYNYQKERRDKKKHDRMRFFHEPKKLDALLYRLGRKKHTISHGI